MSQISRTPSWVALVHYTSSNFFLMCMYSLEWWKEYRFDMAIVTVTNFPINSEVRLNEHVGDIQFKDTETFLLQASWCQSRSIPTSFNWLTFSQACAHPFGQNRVPPVPTRFHVWVNAALVGVFNHEHGLTYKAGAPYSSYWHLEAWSPWYRFGSGKVLLRHIRGLIALAETWETWMSSF